MLLEPVNQRRSNRTGVRQPTTIELAADYSQKYVTEYLEHRTKEAPGLKDILPPAQLL